MRQRVLVTGATGFVGQFLVRRLCAEGAEDVRLLVRHPDTAGVFDGLPVEVVTGDLANTAEVLAATVGVNVVYHLGAAKDGSWVEHRRVTVDGTRHVVQAVRQRAGARLVYVSSVAVYGIPRRPAPLLDESTPYADGDITDYARAKIAAERIVREAIAQHGLAATILRPGIIHEPDRAMHLSRIGLYTGRTVFMIGTRDIVLPLVAVGNVVEALLLAGRSTRGDGQVYHVIDEPQVTKNAHIRQLHATGSLRRRIVVVPRSVAAMVGWAARRLAWCHRACAGLGTILTPLHLRACTTELRFDTSKIRHELGWQPDVRVSQRAAAVRAASPT